MKQKLHPTSWRTELVSPAKDVTPQPECILWVDWTRYDFVTYDVGFLISEFLRCQGEAYRRNWSAPYKYWSQVSQSKVRPGCNAIKLENGDVILKSLFMPILVNLLRSNFERFILCLSFLIIRNLKEDKETFCWHIVLLQIVLDGSDIVIYT